MVASLCGPSKDRRAGPAAMAKPDWCSAPQRRRHHALHRRYRGPPRPRRAPGGRAALAGAAYPLLPVDIQAQRHAPGIELLRLFLQRMVARRLDIAEQPLQAARAEESAT